jgi:hypothetical protein
MKYRLRVNVEPHRSWVLSDTASALHHDIDRLDAAPVVSILVPCCGVSPIGKNRRELVVLKYLDGDDADASRQIFHMGVLLNNSGWRVQRLRVDGDALDAYTAKRAIYSEICIAISEQNAPYARDIGFAISVSNKQIYATSRAQSITDLLLARANLLLRETGEDKPLVVSAIVIDTYPELDKDWMR